MGDALYVASWGIYSVGLVGLTYCAMSHDLGLLFAVANIGGFVGMWLYGDEWWV